MQSAGNSSTSAPSSASRARSPPACAVARVTTMRLPNSGRRSNHADLLAQRDDVADDGDHRRAEPLARHGVGERRDAWRSTVRWRRVACPTGPRPPACPATSRPRRAQRRCAAASSRPCTARSCRRRARAPPSRSASPLRRILVTGDEGDRRRHAAMRDGNSGVRRRGDARRHAGHDLERHAGRGERLRFLAAAAEHERIAALEPHDALALASELHEQRVDVVLARRLRAAAALADVVQLDVGVRRRVPPATIAGLASASVAIASHVASSSPPRTVSRPGSPGPAPDEIDDAVPLSSLRRAISAPVALQRGDAPQHAARDARRGSPCTARTTCAATMYAAWKYPACLVSCSASSLGDASSSASRAASSPSR